MTYKTLMFIHLYTILPCIVLGAVNFMLRKGSPYHKYVGSTFMIFMLFTAAITLFMPAHVGPKFMGHFGYIHLFSFLTIYSIPTAYIAIKKGNVKKHRNKLVGLYIGAILLAGAFTLMPGRYLHTVLFT